MLEQTIEVALGTDAEIHRAQQAKKRVKRAEKKKRQKEKKKLREEEEIKLSVTSSKPSEEIDYSHCLENESKVEESSEEKKSSFSISFESQFFDSSWSYEKSCKKPIALNKDYDPNESDLDAYIVKGVNISLIDS